MDLSKKITVSLKDAWLALGYPGKEQQISLIKLMVYDGLIDYPSAMEVKARIGTIITEQEAGDLLNAVRFSSLQDAIAYVVNKTNTTEGWLRPSHEQEGNNAGAQVNMERWNMRETKKYSINRTAIIALLNSIAMPSIEWPAGEKIQHVLLHGGLESHIVERLKLLQPFTGNLYYLTGPRGAFNFEASTAAIIAEWLGKPEATESISAILKAQKDESNWLKGLTAVKEAILKATGTDTWPTNKGYFYENGVNKEIYLAAGKNIQDWPVATDLVAYLLKQKQLKDPGQFSSIQLIGVPTLGKGEKLANTEDNMERWLQDYGQQLIAANPTSEKINIVCLSSATNDLFMVERQDLVAKQYLSAKDFQVFTLGHITEEPIINVCLDTLTRLLYVKQKIWQQRSLPTEPLPLVFSKTQSCTAIPSIGTGINNVIAEHAGVETTVVTDEITKQSLNIK